MSFRLRSLFGKSFVNCIGRVAKGYEVDNTESDRFPEETVEKRSVCLRQLRHIGARVRNFGRVRRTDEGHERPVIVRVDFATVSHPDLIANAVVMELRNRRLKHSDDIDIGAKRNPVAKSDRGIAHETSLTGYGADLVSAPVATMEGATSVVGDIVRDGTDKTVPEAHDASVESSVATGAAARKGSQRRPHPKPTTDTGSDQR